MSSQTVCPISRGVLHIDASAETERICSAIRDAVRDLKRKGVVVGVSGGIDSSVVAYLCARALGPERVLALLMPEMESSDDSTRLGHQVTDALGVRTVLEDITPILQSAGCYQRRDAAIREAVPEYGAGHKSKLILPNLLEQDRYSIFSIVVQSPSGQTRTVRLSLDQYLSVVAATNFKQRVRKMMEYYHADRVNFAVAGTPNRLEYDLGFFVKNGDGAADLKPIAHLYKSQVYQLAAYLKVPEEIQHRPPTTDTYSLAQSQEEFYFSMPLSTLDLCLYGIDHDISAKELAPAVELSPEQVTRAYSMIRSKRRIAHYLRLPPVTFDRPNQ